MEIATEDICRCWHSIDAVACHGATCQLAPPCALAFTNRPSIPPLRNPAVVGCAVTVQRGAVGKIAEM